MKWLFLFISIITIIIYFTHLTNKKKRENLMKKYNDLALVERLMNKQFWQGQTTSQLIDSLGRPNDIGKQVLKSKTKETWKYQKTGNNRFGLKIFIEEGIVVGWDQK